MVRENRLIVKMVEIVGIPLRSGPDATRGVNTLWINILWWSFLSGGVNYRADQYIILLLFIITVF